MSRDSPAKGTARRAANLGESDPMFPLDTWEVEGLRIGVDVPDHVTVRRLLFGGFPAGHMRDCAKRYAYFMLAVGMAVPTVSLYLGNVRSFASWWAGRGHPSFSDVRAGDVAEHVRGRSDLKASTRNGLLGALKSFFDLGALLAMPSMPRERMRLDESLRARVDCSYTDPYSQAEVDGMLSCTDLMWPPAARMLEVMCRSFCRFSEVSTMRRGQLTEGPGGEWSLELRLHKTHGRVVVPVVAEVARSIVSAHEYSRAFDPQTEYVFLNPRSPRGDPVRRQVFCDEVERACAAAGVVDDEGRPVRVRTHRFRAYLATKMVNDGVDVEHVRMLMGHRSAGALWHYAQIHAPTALGRMAPVLERRAWHIEHMGRVFEGRASGDVTGLPLSNGRCARPTCQEVCAHANRCYGCAWFVPRASDLNLYERRLAEAEEAAEEAEAGGQVRHAQSLRKLADDLRSVIRSVGAKS